METELAALILGLVGGGFAGAFVRKKPDVIVTPLIEVSGVTTAPQGGHKHIWNTFLNDDKGIRCGYVVEDGVICGWARD